MRGRKPVPNNIHRLHGNPGKRQLNPDEPTPDVVSAGQEPPADLNPEAQAVWRDLLPKLVQARVMTELDLDMLKTYCEQFAALNHANRMLAEEGPVQLVNGFLRESAWLKVAEKARTWVHKIGVEFGMSPSSRSRVKKVEAPQGPNRFE